MTERLQLFLEDQHPLARANLKLGVGVLVLILILHVGVYVAVRVLDVRTVFRLDTLLRAFGTLLLLLVIMMSYNALKSAWAFIRGQSVLTIQGVMLAIFGVLLVVLSIINLPSIFERSVAATVGRSYGDIYQDFHDICLRWEEEWRDAEAVTLDVDEEDLGRLRDEAEVYKVQNTIMFNFSHDETLDFGLACALRDAGPSDVGRARQYSYRRVSGPQYQFMEQAQ